MLDQIELGRRLGRFDVDFSGGLAAGMAIDFLKEIHWETMT